MQGPIFVCGASRSGTALVRSILNNEPTVMLAGETHYFDDLRSKLRDPAAALTAAEAEGCADYFLALAHRPYGHSGDAGQAQMDREQLKRLAEGLGGSADAYFEAFCKLSAGTKSTARWGEKTPRHIYRLQEMLTRYPDAQAICMIRDPRAVVASYRDWKNQGGFDLEKDPGHEAALELDQARVRRSYHPLIITLLWKGTVGSARRALQTFGPQRVWIQQYEKLVTNPTETVQAIAHWLGISYRKEMLDVPLHNSSFSRFDSAGGVSTAPLERWKQKLSPKEIAVIQAACGPLLREVDYEVIDVPAAPLARAWAWSTLPLASARALLANRQRMGNIPSYLLRRAGALFSARSG